MPPYGISPFLIRLNRVNRDRFAVCPLLCIANSHLSFLPFIPSFVNGNIHGGSGISMALGSRLDGLPWPSLRYVALSKTLFPRFRAKQGGLVKDCAVSGLRLCSLPINYA